MSEPENLILEHLKAIREEQKDIKKEISSMRQETSAKIGALAEGMVSVKTTIEKLRNDINLIALSVDEHTNRLEKIESHFLTPQH